MTYIPRWSLDIGRMAAVVAFATRANLQGLELCLNSWALVPSAQINRCRN
jgi:hypothetical protein